jgi:hypothetical protein
MTTCARFVARTAGYGPDMDTAEVVATIALLVVSAIVLVVAAFLDRRRGREIEHDRSRLSVAPDQPVRANSPDQRRNA